jgi:hypothetical protein
MHVRLNYRSGLQYSQGFSNFQAKVFREGTRVNVSFKEKSDSSYAKFSLPAAKAAQLSHAINLQAVLEGTVPISFSVTETPARTNVRLTYSSGLKEYWEPMPDFDVTISRKGTRVKVSFKEKGDFRYFAFSLPVAKAVQLAHAINLHAVSDGAEPIHFEVMETPAKAVAA